MRMWKLLLVLVVCAARPVAAGPLEDAETANNKGDYETALRVYRSLAEHGNARAQHDLGVMYENGRGVARDYTAAVAWYRKAADLGDAKAQASLGLMYSGGRDVPVDDVQAHMWLSLAASQRAAFNEEERKRIIQTRDIIALKMTPTQAAEAQKLAREWKPNQER